MNSETATSRHSLGSSGQLDLRGTLYESQVAVDLVRLRQLTKGQKYHLVLHLVNELPDALRQELISDIGGLVEPATKLSQLKIVRAAARTFGQQAFALDQICTRIEKEFPGSSLDRRIVARRIYDLQRASPPVIEKIEPNAGDGISGVTTTVHLYRNTGPPAESPRAGVNSSARCPG